MEYRDNQSDEVREKQVNIYHAHDRTERVIHRGVGWGALALFLLGVGGCVQGCRTNNLYVHNPDVQMHQALSRASREANESKYALDPKTYIAPGAENRDAIIAELDLITKDARSSVEKAQAELEERLEKSSEIPEVRAHYDAQIKSNLWGIGGLAMMAGSIFGGLFLNEGLEKMNNRLRDRRLRKLRDEYIDSPEH